MSSRDAQQQQRRAAQSNVARTGRQMSSASSIGHAALLQRYRDVRATSLRLMAPLSAEDCALQSMPDASPVKWHLGHTTWFFETFILERDVSHVPFDIAYRVLFNSYYNAIGDKHPRPKRGLLSRPALREVLEYRAHVDDRIEALLQRASVLPEVAQLVELGIQHEQQHQELILTDLKHLLSCNPLRPVYSKSWPLTSLHPTRPRWLAVRGGAHVIGHDGDGFAFDNEGPRHRVWLEDCEIASQL